MKELEDCLREALEESPYGIVTNDTALETARKYASELLRQRDELNSRIVCSFYLRTAKNQISYSLFHVKHSSSLSNSGTVVQHSVVI